VPILSLLWRDRLPSCATSPFHHQMRYPVANKAYSVPDQSPLANKAHFVPDQSPVSKKAHSVPDQSPVVDKAHFVPDQKRHGLFSKLMSWQMESQIIYRIKIRASNKFFRQNVHIYFYSLSKILLYFLFFKKNLLKHKRVFKFIYIKKIFCRYQSSWSTKHQIQATSHLN
jgi:hypothetical protein